jgi:Holliday junction DNA helicase RuvA
MIGRLRGTLIEKSPNKIIIEVAGVGYQVLVPLSTFYELGDLQTQVSLLIYTHLREDSLCLYGFLKSREKQLFEILITASGVGPALALKILSGMSVDDLGPAIGSGDIAQLIRIPGVGKKTAERIVVELRDKLAALAAAAPERPASRSQLEADVLSALVNLGYDRRLAERAVAEAQKNGAGGNFEALLRASLQQLSRPAGRSGA